MKICSTIVFGLAAWLVAIAPAVAATHDHRGHRGRHVVRHHRAYAQHTARREYPYYGRPYDPTPTCYSGGTPYDTDLTGGPNHVGEGGPAASFGLPSNPCDPIYLGGPGLIGPR